MSHEALRKARVLIVDDETAITQSDFILADDCVTNCVLSYTVLNAVQAANRARADKLRSLCGSKGPESEVIPGRKFFAFPNEFHSETFVPFSNPQVSEIDRDFMACLEVAKWYSNHTSVRVVLIVSSEKKCEFAISNGVECLKVWEYADSVRDKFPLAGEYLASPSFVSQATESEFTYPAHLTVDELARGLKDGSIKQGILRMAIGTCIRGSVGDVEIAGKVNLNRALDGDVVAFEVLPQNSEDVSENLLVADQEETGDGVEESVSTE
ncbi:hypothetical protein EBZ37_15005, partial [bacterium]|nr:hypothetical protein [bacterium]